MQRKVLLVAFALSLLASVGAWMLVGKTTKATHSCCSVPETQK